MSDSEIPLHESMERIRQALQGHGFVGLVISRLEFAHVCAAADALQDADAAIAEWHRESGGLAGSYLRLYGVLQATQIQQDCADVLRQAFGLPELDPRPNNMEAIRSLRNRVVGHPSEPRPSRRRKSPATWISRMSLEGGQLEVWRTDPPGECRSTHQRFNLAEMLNAHSRELRVLANEIVEAIREREAVFCAAQIEKGPAASLLHESWSYLFGKIHESAGNDRQETGSLVLASATTLEGILNSVVTGLSDRGLPSVHDWHVKTARAALQRLTGLAKRLDEGDDVALDIEAFAELAERHFRDIAKHLDAIDARLKEHA